LVFDVRFIPIDGAGVGRAFDFRGLLRRGMHEAGAAVALLFPIVVLGHGGIKIKVERPVSWLTRFKIISARLS
jgi:hypothetical protein